MRIKAKKGDHILQPGDFDGGQDPEHKVGELLRFVRLKKAGANLVDCAVASIDGGIEFDHRTLTGLGKLAGLGDAVLADEDRSARSAGPPARPKAACPRSSWTTWSSGLASAS